MEVATKKLILTVNPYRGWAFDRPLFAMTSTSDLDDGTLYAALTPDS